MVGGLLIMSSFLCASFKTFEFHDRLSSLLKSPKYKDVKVGISIQQLSNKNAEKVVYEKNQYEYFIPASMMKLMLSATVFSYLHPLEQFETPIYTNGFISNNILQGDLIIKGIGDPSLTTTHLLQIVKAIKSLGIHKIEGKLIYDDSFLEKPSYSGTSARYYNALSSALNLNNNVVHLNIKKDYSGLEPEYKTSYVSLIDKSVINKKSSRIGFPKLTVEPFLRGDRYTISGTVTHGDEKNHNLECAVTRPSVYFATCLYELFQSNGIDILGNIEKGMVPDDRVLLGIIKGDMLKDIVYELNQDSNNMIADSLGKSLGGSLFGAPGTTEKGVRAIKKFCYDDLSIAEEDIYIYDASGLSVDNRITPRQFSTLLDNVYKKQRIGVFLIDSLVKQGVHPDHVHPIPPSYLDVRLKTGTLAQHGINTMGGYIFDSRSNDVYSFVIMTENHKASPKSYQGTYTNPILSLIFSEIQ